MESVKCNIYCDIFIINGECGGIGYLSMYELMNVMFFDIKFGGFCLICC